MWEHIKKFVLSPLGYILGLIGLFGLPEDVQNMWSAMEYIAPLFDNNLVKLFSVILLGLLITKFFLKHKELIDTDIRPIVYKNYKIIKNFILGRKLAKSSGLKELKEMNHKA